MCIGCLEVYIWYIYGVIHRYILGAGCLEVYVWYIYDYGIYGVYTGIYWVHTGVNMVMQYIKDE